MQRDIIGLRVSWTFEHDIRGNKPERPDIPHSSENPLPCQMPGASALFGS
jgi:hypothetical protein